MKIFLIYYRWLLNIPKQQNYMFCCSKNSFKIKVFLVQNIIIYIIYHFISISLFMSIHSDLYFMSISQFKLRLNQYYLFIFFLKIFLRYGGYGYDAVQQFLINLRDKYKINQDVITMISRTNMLNFMNWWVAEKPKIIEVKKWTCPE